MKKLIILLGLFFSFISMAVAGTLNIVPTQIYFDPHETIETLTLTNPSDEVMLMQLQLVQWQQQKEQDIYTDTDDILVTPPFFELPPHKTQLIRFALQRPFDRQVEQTYRVFVKEVVPSRTASLKNQLRIALQISIPIKITPQDIIQDFQWQGHFIDRHQLKLQIINAGNVSILVSDWQLFAGKKSLTAKKQMFYYVLPNQRHTWIVPIKYATNSVQIAATINGLMINTSVQML